MPAGRWPDKREQAFFALKTLRCERVFPLRSKRFAVSALPSSMRDGCADLVSTASRSSPRRRAFTFALKTLRCEHVFPLHSKRFAVSALETNDRPTLKAQRVECHRKEVAPTCPRPRFARRGQASRNSIEQRRQAARSAACPFDCAGEICKPRSGVKSSTQSSSLARRSATAHQPTQPARRPDVQLAPDRANTTRC